ncbi:MAG: FixH family protein [Actinomycetota bacterium]|nr:FixH family protein [Actinomycetota bacterium]
MAISAAPPEARSGETNPVLIVAGTLLAVVLVTFLIFAVGDYDGQDGAGGGTANLAGGAASGGVCGQGSTADSSYGVDIVATPEPPRPEGTTFLLTPRHDGKPVAGAKVCLTADMPEMQHPSINTVAKESSGGRYEARLQFGMGGTWRTWVTIAEPDRPVVSVPLSIQVAQVDAG